MPTTHPAPDIPADHIEIRALGPGPIKWTGPPIQPGQRAIVPREPGERWVQRGWAEDVSGQIPTGERRVTHSTLEMPAGKPAPKRAAKR